MKTKKKPTKKMRIIIGDGNGVKDSPVNNDDSSQNFKKFADKMERRRERILLRQSVDWLY